MDNEKLVAVVERVRAAKAKAEAAGKVVSAARDALDVARMAAAEADDEWREAERALIEVARG